MSYDISLCGEDGKPLELPEKHDLRGGIYAVGGTDEAWLNVTYNYWPHFIRVLGENGIRTIYGLTAEESIPLLEGAIAQLADDENEDYWAPTEGNARRALLNLLALAHMCPTGRWHGD